MLQYSPVVHSTKPFSLGSANSQCRRAFVLRSLILHGRADFDATLENSAVLDADAGGLDIAEHRAVPFDFNAIPGIHIAADLAVN